MKADADAVFCCYPCRKKRKASPSRISSRALKMQESDDFLMTQARERDKSIGKRSKFSSCTGEKWVED